MDLYRVGVDMKKETFFELLTETLDITSVDTIDESTQLRDLEEYDSLAVLSLIAMVDEHFGKRLPGSEFQKVTTVESLMSMIGPEQFD